MQELPKLALSNLQFQGKKKRQNHCRTQSSQVQQYRGYIQSRILQSSRNHLKHTSRTRQTLQGSGFAQNRIERIGNNKICWFKSLSPKPKNIIITVRGQPTTVTAKMIQQARMRQRSSRQNPQMGVEHTPIKHIRHKNSLIHSQSSTNAFDSIAKDRRMKSVEHHPFKNTLNRVTS